MCGEVPNVPLYGGKFSYSDTVWFGRTSAQTNTLVVSDRDNDNDILQQRY